MYGCLEVHTDRGEGVVSESQRERERERERARERERETNLVQQQELAVTVHASYAFVGKLKLQSSIWTVAEGSAHVSTTL